MFYHAIVLNNIHMEVDEDGYETGGEFQGYAVVRPADNGINDYEWQHGCRIYNQDSFKSMELLKRTVVVTGEYHLLNMDDWNDLISSLDEPANVPNNNFISTVVKEDKWDVRRPIY